MDYRKFGPTALLGVGAFAAGVIAYVLGRRNGGERAGATTRNGGQGGARSPADTRMGGAIPAPTGKAEGEKGFVERAGTPAAEHVPTDLLADAPVTAATRAPDAFRPDPTAVPTAKEREGLRPATGPAPTLSAERGSVNA